MIDAHTQQGATLKLCSERGTLLGTIMVPHDWLYYLRERNYVQFSCLPRRLGFDSKEPVTCKEGAQIQSYAIKGAVELHGISIEEFEQLPGCSFSPGAAYLRSLIE